MSNQVKKRQEQTQLDQLLNFIYTSEYTSIRENQITQQILKNIINAIQLMPLDQRFFESAQKIIKFYGVQILYAFQKTYQNFVNDKQLVDKYQDQLQKIAKLVKTITQGKHIHQIRFFFFKGVDPKYTGKRKQKQDELTLLNYFQKLSGLVKKQKNIGSANQEQRQMRQQLTDQILQMKINRVKQLNQFQQRFQNHIKSQIQFGMKSFDQQNGNVYQKIDQKIQDHQKNIYKKQSFKETQIHKPIAQTQKMELKQKQKSKVQQDQQDKDEPSFDQSIKPANDRNRKLQANNKKPIQMKPFEQQADIQQTPVCCRKFFYLNEIIYQPQSLTIDYKYYNNPLQKASYSKILNTICGMLNIEGGNIFIGIKANRQTLKKQVLRYVIFQSQKAEFIKNMNYLIQNCILPQLSHDMYKIYFVPIKDQKTKNYISGQYVIKIWVKFGLRKQVYSYKEDPNSKKQWFSFKTQNQVRIVESCQQILKITKQRLLNPPAQPKPPFHEGHCKKPDLGRPLFQDDNYQKNYNDEPQQEDKTKKVYCQKQTPYYENLIVIGFQKSELNTHLLKNCSIPQDYFRLSVSQSNAKAIIVSLKNEDYFRILQTSLKREYNDSVKLIIASTKIKCSLDEQALKDLVFHTKQQNVKSTKVDKSGVTFQNITVAIQFYLQLIEMGLQAAFVTK